MPENWDKPFWRSVFSENDGTGSMTRICIAVVVFFSCLWITYVTFYHHQLPEFAGIGGFVGGVCSALYGINQYATFKKSQIPEAPQDKNS